MNLDYKDILQTKYANLNNNNRNDWRQSIWNLLQCEYLFMNKEKQESQKALNRSPEFCS